MNLTNFLKQTDAMTAQYSAGQLAAFVHEIGRTLPEQHREGFLQKLKATGEGTQSPSNKDKMAAAEFGEAYRQIRNNLKVIDSQEITLNAMLNEEYDEWYDDSDEEFYYEDECGISDMLAQACDFVHAGMDMGKYQEAYAVGRQLFAMEILCMNEYGDEELSIGDVAYHGLLHCDLRRVLLDTLYCAYHAVPLKKRPEALYEVIANAGNREITLEAVMQHGDEDLPDFREFLTCWITYLGGQTGRDVGCLISEAAGLLNDVPLAVGYAKKFAAVHPGLYLRILDNKESVDAKTMMSIGIEAMKNVPGNYVMRSRIALKTAGYVTEAKGGQVLLEQCYFAAYESDTSAVNYLRALLNGYGDSGKREELRKIFMMFSVHESGGSYGMSGYGTFTGGSIYNEREENKPDGNMILMLKFLDGQFADVLKKGLNQSEALGWTGTFMKQGIALFLLYLYEGQLSGCGKGIHTMVETAKGAMLFSAAEYCRGVCGLDGMGDQELFCDLFSKWKSMVQMEPDVRTRAVKKITDLLEKRTEGIMNANRRNYYGECAAYIAALGEVQESFGDAGAKQRLMTSYKEKYSRRSAFREEMRGYDWIDSKRK